MDYSVVGARYDRDNAHTDAMTGFNVQLSQRPHNVFYIQSHFEVSEQETFLIRLINLGSPLSYHLKIFQLVWHWHFYLLYLGKILIEPINWDLDVSIVYLLSTLILFSD